MKKEIKYKSKFDGEITIHIKRNINTIEKADLEEYGKCAFCSMEHKDKNICKSCTKNFLYEIIEEC